MTILTTRVAGVTFCNADGSSRQALLGHVKAGDGVLLQREWNNDYDPHAIAVFHAAGQLGYVPKEVAAKLAKIGFDKAAIVAEVRGGSETAPTKGCDITINAGRQS